MRTAFEVNAYPQVPLDHFRLDHLDIQAKTAGHIHDAKDWAFSDTVLKTDDDTPVLIFDTTGITGIVTAPGPPKPQEPAKKSFAEQDKEQ